MRKIKDIGGAVVVLGVMLSVGRVMGEGTTLPRFAGDAVHVALEGDDGNVGSAEKPVLTVEKGLSLVKPGGAVVVHGGTYAMKNALALGQSGAEGKPLVLMGMPEEKVELDFAGVTGRRRGISVTGAWWVIKGIGVSHAYGGMVVTGSHVVIEQCATHDNRETGMQFSNGASHVRVINCDSYDNADPAANDANADGFAPKLTVGDDIYFYGCRSWGNCDDGWDGYMRGASNVTTVLENCWTFRNGWLKDGTDPGPQANGNGFKLGGGDGGNAGNLMHHFVLKNCVAFENKVTGFDQNNNVGSMTMLNCSGFKNGRWNFGFYKPLAAGQKLVIKNCVSVEGKDRLPEFAEQAANSWQLGFEVTKEEFVSVDGNAAKGERQKDGSLPAIRFLHLKAGSRLIGRGVEVGLPFGGKAPDLGAFAFEEAERR